MSKDGCDRPHLKLEMLSNPLYLSGARELVSSVARRLGFADQACSQIALALDEALCNVIRHGYGRRPDGPIWVEVWPLCPAHADGCGSGACVAGEPTPPEALCNGSAPEAVGGIRIVIEDEARQVDPATIKGRKLEEIRPGGLGVHIIREVMNQVIYEKRGESGMRLTMVKFKSPVVPAGDPAAQPGRSCGT
ncbi:MAG: ATP-binding protein [Phycisphaeraceae bacterium]|nr:MAG: ATP-binding protein [Phycisphaeraceae bacterium]